MDYFLFLDDERSPAAVGWGSENIRIARSTEEATLLVEQLGLPAQISFDHDLGGDDTGFKFMWWLIDRHMDGAFDLSKLQQVQVHSANEVGAKKLMNLWQNFCEVHELSVPLKRVWPREQA